MKHIAVTESELYTVLFALRCGESRLLELTNDAIESSSPNSLNQVREYHKMRMVLIRLENQLEAKL